MGQCIAIHCVERMAAEAGSWLVTASVLREQNA